MKRFCLHWPRFSPYHLARLRATHGYLAERGVELVGLETARDDELYGWEVTETHEAFRRERVFDNRVFERIPPAEMFQGMLAALDRLQPDVLFVCSYSFADAQAGLWWARRHRRPVVFFTDTKADDAQRSRWREIVKGLLVRQFDAAFVSGEPHRAYFASLGLPETAIFTGYSVVDNAYFRERAEAVRQAPPSQVGHLPGLADPSPFFLCSGRFIERKNLELLLAAYHQYRGRAPSPWRLLLLGDGPLRPRLERYIQQHHLEEVTLAGFQQLEDVATYYGRAGALIHPALTEPWGLVVNEAMAAGLPVLVSETVGCATALVEPGRNGFRFSPTDADQLTGLMVRLSDPSTDLSGMRRASRAIVDCYSPEHFAEQVWAAAEAASHRCDRPLHPAVRLLLLALRLPRHTDAFHTVEA